MAGLLDNLQGGGSYPVTQAGTGRSLLDLLQNLGSGNSDGSDPYAAADAQRAAEAARFAQAQQAADAQAKAALKPQSQWPNQPYAMGTTDPNATLAFPEGTGSPMGFGGSNPGAAPALPPGVGQPPIIDPNVASNGPTTPTVTGSLFSPSSAGALPTQNVNVPPVVPVQADSYAPNMTQPPVDGTPDVQGGLIGSLTQASQDPEQAHGLLQSFGEKAKMLGDKLTNLTPNAAQALLASGLTVLANNNGTRNLGQLVGEGGIAGINNYQTNVQNQAKNALAAQKLQQDLADKNKLRAIEAWKAQNTPVAIAPGSQVTTAGEMAAGRGPGPSTAFKEYAKSTDSDGVEWSTPVGYDGKPIGQPFQTKNPWVGPLNDNERTAVNGYQTQVANTQQSLGRIQGYLSKLSPTMTDPATGQQVPNPDFVQVPGGLAAHAQDIWTKITGDQAPSQQLRAQITQDVVKGQLAQYKEGVGGRLTNADINLLQKGIPTESGDGKALYNYLAKYAVLQQNILDHDTKQATFASSNRGNLGALQRDTQIGNEVVPKGTDFQSYSSGAYKQTPVQSQGGAASKTSAPTGGNPQNVLMQARAAARNGDKAAQAALQQHGLSWN